MNQKEFINVEGIGNAMKEIGIILAKAINSVANAFMKIIENTSEILNNTIFSRKITRKKFKKLLMSQGIQRNEANKITNYYHKKDGCYYLKNVFIELKSYKKIELGGMYEKK